MTDHSKDPTTDPFDLLRAHVRAVALLEQPAVDADELVADITGSVDRADRSRGAQVLPLHGFPGARSPRRRRWLVAGAASVIVAVGGAGVAAYVALRPTDPVAGIVCRESADFGSGSVQLPFDDDPITACANLWRTGDLPVFGGDRPATGAVPELIACAARQGSVQVVPAVVGETCESFGLTPLDVDLGAGAVAQLTQRLAAENAKGCRSAEGMAAAVSGHLTNLELTDWTVDVAEPARCAIGAVISDRRIVTIFADPLRTPSEEKP